MPPLYPMVDEDVRKISSFKLPMLVDVFVSVRVDEGVIVIPSFTSVL